MLLRSLTKHVKDQNWFAVFLDFFIVVAGILIAFQITNWNERRAEYHQETSALVELKKEIEASIVATDAKIDAYTQAANAGKRSLALINNPTDCGDKCWDVVVDFMHASQWQDLNVSYAAYENMRNLGFPKSNIIVEAVEAFRAQNANNADTFEGLPIYRSKVRQIINLKAQEYYWANCWALKDGREIYVLDCPPGMPADEAKKLVNEVLVNPDIKPHLTEWVGAIVSLPQTLGDQNIAARDAINLIQTELENR